MVTNRDSGSLLAVMLVIIALGFIINAKVFWPRWYPRMREAFVILFYVSFAFIAVETWVLGQR